jgi:pimeloyl-ACP methyl ester carboxylesterase
VNETLDFLRDPPPCGEPQLWKSSHRRQLAWNEYGDPDGAPVLFYHGWPGCRLQARLTHHLACQRGLRIIAFDRPGIGLSTLHRQRTLESWPRLMRKFTAAHGIENFGQLGISGGAPYVIACAAEFPERLQASVVLAGAVPLAELGALRDTLHPLYRVLISLRKILPAPAMTGIFRLAGMATRLAPTCPPIAWLLETLPAEDRRILSEFPSVWDVLGSSFREAIRGGGLGLMTDAEIYFHEIPYDLSALRHPIHFWHGEEDRQIPLPLVREFTGKIALARLESVAGLGHHSLVIHKAAAAMDVLAAAARASRV